MASAGHAIVAEREKTHGDYAVTALVAKQIKDAIRGAPNWNALSARQQESLDLIASKIARIMSGDPNEPDHYIDCIGYLELALKSIQK